MAIAVTISNSDVSKWVFPPSVKFSAQLGARWTADYTMVVPSADYLPQLGQNTGLFDFGVRVFNGQLDTIVKKRLGNKGGYKLDITCTSLEKILESRYIPPRTYKDKTAGFIVNAVVSEFGGGVHLGTIHAGVTVPKVVYDYTQLSSALDTLATLCNYIWYCDTEGHLQFTPREAVAAPIGLTDIDILRTSSEQIQSTQSRDNFRDREYIRVDFSAFAPEIETFPGDGATTQFAVTKMVNRVDSMVISSATSASVNGTFTGQPANGDTITINGQVYTFKTTLDNTIPNQILIDSSYVSSLIDAVNGQTKQGSVPGTNYSLPTSAHPNCALQPGTGGASITALYEPLGTVGNGITVSESSTAFSWAASTMSGGTKNGATLSVDFGNFGVDTGKSWYFSNGEKVIIQDPGSVDTPSAPLKSTDSLTVTYRPLGGDVIAIEDTPLIGERARIEADTPGIYEHLTDDSKNTDAQNALSKVQSILSAYKTLPTIIELFTRRDGIHPGMLLQLATLNPAISGAFLVNAVDASYVPTDQHFRYKLTLLDSSRILTWIQFWELLAIIGGGGGSVASNSNSAAAFDDATFNIAVILDAAVASDVAPHYIIKTSGPPLICQAQAKVAPVGAPLILDIIQTPAAGGGPRSIFGTTKMVIPDGSTALAEQAVFAAGIKFNPNDILTVNILSTGITTPGSQITMKLFWATG